MYDAAETETADLQVDIDVSQRSEMDDEDKILFTLIGKTEISIDKVLSNLLVLDEF